MQAGAQGAWGIIPAHINELAPNAVRGLMPGFAYQFGILIAAGTNNIEYALRDQLGYSWALTAFEATNILLLITVVALGSERKGRNFIEESGAWVDFDLDLLVGIASLWRNVMLPREFRLYATCLRSDSAISCELGAPGPRFVRLSTNIAITSRIPITANAKRASRAMKMDWHRSPRSFHSSTRPANKL